MLRRANIRVPQSRLNQRGIMIDKASSNGKSWER
ncbi:hypothetical protein WH7805_13043 [Synechococcus sp. WH 7805]|nr:hypothetical protein WH7805_13043 [Synechococcus sp. WH 7805]